MKATLTTKLHSYTDHKTTYTLTLTTRQDCLPLPDHTTCTQYNWSHVFIDHCIPAHVPISFIYLINYPRETCLHVLTYWHNHLGLAVSCPPSVYTRLCNKLFNMNCWLVRDMTYILVMVFMSITHGLCSWPDILPLACMDIYHTDTYDEQLTSQWPCCYQTYLILSVFITVCHGVVWCNFL